MTLGAGCRPGLTRVLDRHHTGLGVPFGPPFGGCASSLARSSGPPSPADSLGRLSAAFSAPRLSSGSATVASGWDFSRSGLPAAPTTASEVPCVPSSPQLPWVVPVCPPTLACDSLLVLRLPHGHLRGVLPEVPCVPSEPPSPFGVESAWTLSPLPEALPRLPTRALRRRLELCSPGQFSGTASPTTRADYTDLISGRKRKIRAHVVFSRRVHLAGGRDVERGKEQRTWAAALPLLSASRPRARSG